MESDGDSPRSTQEDDLLDRPTKRYKESHEKVDLEKDQGEGSQRPTYKDILCGSQGNASMWVDGSDGEEEDVSGDDFEEEVVDSSMFGMGMSRHEKMAARKPWRTSMIIKFVGSKIGYQYLLR